MKNTHRVLMGRILQEKKDIHLVIEKIERLIKIAKTSNDDAYFDAVALNLHGFYTGVERIFKDIAKTIDNESPSRSDWHKQLIFQMSADIPGVRPKVITTKTRYCLDEYRSFRHVVRNVYTFSFRFSRLTELAEESRSCYQNVFNDLDSFVEFLKELDEDDNEQAN
ncbi:MAG: hypothetical protein HQK75_05825 [Candidatus Magnetomorum sp.]|nr:hypothetical protein [Candidatus Magnetomorum sp.]